MAQHTNTILPTYDFTEALSLSLDERITQSLLRAQSIVAANGHQSASSFPCVPETGASEEELVQMEFDLGLILPEEYRHFLTRCRYLSLNEGLEIGGLDHDGTYYTEIPWVSDGEHRPKTAYLVFANFTRYADGDQLMFDLADPAHPVIAYLHEHGPLYELYAPSLSLALWRLTHESSLDN